MTNIPPNFSPTIPARGTPEFARYAAEVMTAHANGRILLIRTRHPLLSSAWATLIGVPAWQWESADYAILPDPEPAWPSDDVWSERFCDPKWQCLLVRIKDAPPDVSSAQITLSQYGWNIRPIWMALIGQSNFMDYEISHDGGKTWGPIC